MLVRKNLPGICWGAFALAFSLAIAAPGQASPVTMYVATNGSYSHTRLEATNPLTPFSTITRAAQLAQPGDTIEVAPGVYTGSVIIAYNSNLLIHGKAGAARPVLKSTADNDYALVKITGSDNITFSGFEVDGTGAGPDCGGILIIPRTDTTTGVITTCHDIVVSSCKVHDAGGGGIGSGPDPTYTIGCDFIRITGNEIYNCLTTGKYRGSAISLHQDQDTTKTAGYHSYVENNDIHDNVNMNRDLDANGNVDAFKHTDGNGVIIDTTGFQGPKILIQNNLVYRNGGRGLHVFDSSNVDVLNNTVFGNDLDPYLAGGGELTTSTTNSVLFSNNVVQGNGKAPAFRVGHVYGTTNGVIRFKNNTYTATYAVVSSAVDANGNKETSAAIDWNTTVYSDPSWGGLFVNPALNDFHLQALAARAGLSSLLSQTALNRGSSAAGEFASSDITGVVRKPATGDPPGGYVDRGAYEQSGQVTVTRGGYRYQRTNGHVFQAVTLTAVGGNAEGPVSLVLDGLTGASLLSPTGVTSATSPTGSPYVNTAGVLSDASATVVLEFTGYPNGYATRTLIGSAPR